MVLAAVPREVAGGAGGIFSTSQRLGGALGVAIVGSVFFARLEEQAFTAAFERIAPVVSALFLAAAALSLALPHTAVSETEAADS